MRLNIGGRRSAEHDQDYDLYLLTTYAGRKKAAYYIKP
jgi:hypothetical protein